MSSHHTNIISFLTVCALSVGASIASANGIAVARFGGGHGNVTESNPASIYYNPGGIGFSEGSHMMFDLSLVQRNASYDRPVSAIGEENPSEEVIAANSGEATLSNQLYAPMIGFTTDFGGAFGLRAGIAAFVPFGGASVWDTTDQVGDFQESDMGTTRWWNVEGFVRTSAIALNVAYLLGPVSFGISGNLYYSQIDTIRSRNANATDNPETEGVSWVRGNSVDYGIGAGALFQASDSLAVGASYQSRPNLNGEIVYEGEISNAFPSTGGGDPEDIYLTQQLPDIFRLGVRYRKPDTNFELRAFADLTRWSVFEQQCLIESEGLTYDEAREACNVAPDGAPANGDLTFPITNSIRQWNDAFGIRVGGSYFLPGVRQPGEDPAIELMTAFGFDQNAIPDETLEPAFFDHNKVSLDLGGRIRLGRLAVAVTGTGIFYQEREVTSNESVTNSMPSLQPNSNGVYNQSIWLLDTTLEYEF